MRDLKKMSSELYSLTSSQLFNDNYYENYSRKLSISEVSAMLNKIRDITSSITVKTEHINSLMSRIDFVYYGSDTPIVPHNTILAKVGTHVCSLPACLFWNRQHLRCVTIPFNVTAIGPRVFENCRRLCSVNLHSNIETIGANAFRRCISLDSIYIPPSLKYLEENLFSGCPIKYITLPPAVLSIEQWAFSNCNELETVIVNSPTININKEAFLDCDNLIHIKVSEQTRCIIISTTENNKRKRPIVNNRVLRFKDFIRREISSGMNPRMKGYQIKKEHTFATTMDMIGVNRKDYLRKEIGKYVRYFVFVDWKQCATCKSIKSGRYPLYTAAFNNVHLRKGLMEIFEAYPPAIHNKDPILQLEAFMIAAIGRSSRLSSIYYLLKQYPQAIIEHVAYPTETSNQNETRKRKRE